MADIRDDLAAIPDLLRRKYDQYTSLKAQPDENLGDMAVQTAAGFIPGVGQAMGARDVARAWGEGDKTGLALSAASMLPFGALVKGLRNSAPVQKIMAGDLAKNAPLADMAAGEAALSANYTPHEVWRDLKVERGPENHQPMKWEIDDSLARVKPHDEMGNRTFTQDKIRPEIQDYHGPIGQVYHHPELYANYPEVKDYVATLRIDPSLKKSSATFYPGSKEIYAEGPSHASLTTPVLHEFDHAVADIQGFDPGAGYKQIKNALVEQLRSSGRVIPKDIDEQAYSIYRKNMGEGSAWGTEERFRRGPAYREQIPPSYDHRRAAGVLAHEEMIPYERLPGSK